MRPTLLQTTQRALSWKLRMVVGARGTLYPREQTLPFKIKVHLLEIQRLLGQAEKLIRAQLLQNKAKKNETLTKDSL